MYASPFSFGGLGPAAPAALTIQAHFAQGSLVRAEQDRRWPMILRKLAGLRRRNRRSLRILDVHCGTGDLLLAAAQRARAMGFCAIEARGIDVDPAKIAQARRTSVTIADSALGVDFTMGDAAEALREEAEFPADIVLHAGQTREIALLAHRAGSTVLRQAAKRG